MIGGEGRGAGGGRGSSGSKESKANVVFDEKEACLDDGEGREGVERAEGKGRETKSGVQG